MTAPAHTQLTRDDQRPASDTSPAGMSPQEVQALPVTFPFDPVIPAAFGISRSAAYRALKAGQLPITPFKLGRRLLVRRIDLLRALGMAESAE
jgi:hypothetical protein